jgi:DNA primase
MLDQLPRGVYRELMFQQLANRTQLSIDALMTLLNELPVANEGPSNEPYHTAPPNYESGPPPAEDVNTYHHQEDYEKYNDSTMQAHPYEQKATLSSDRLQSKPTTKQLKTGELALALLLFQPTLAKAVTDIESLRHSKHENVALLIEMIDLLHQRPEYTSGHILGHWQGTYGPEKGQSLQEFLSKGLLFHHVSELNQDQKEHNFNPEEEFSDAIQHLQKQQQDEDCLSIIQQLNAKPLETWTEAEKQLYGNAIVAKANLH